MYITHIRDSLLILKSDPTCLCLSSCNCKLNLALEIGACPEHRGTTGVIPLFFLELMAETFCRSSSAVIRPARQETITKYFAQSHAKYQQKTLPQPSGV